MKLVLRNLKYTTGLSVNLAELSSLFKRKFKGISNKMNVVSDSVEFLPISDKHKNINAFFQSATDNFLPVKDKDHAKKLGRNYYISNRLTEVQYNLVKQTLTNLSGLGIDCEVVLIKENEETVYENSIPEAGKYTTERMPS